MSKYLDQHPIVRQTISERAWNDGQWLYYQATAILDDPSATRIQIDMRLDTSVPRQTALYGKVWSQVDQRWNIAVNYPLECASRTLRTASAYKSTFKNAPATAFVDDVPLIVDELAQIVWEPETA